MFRIYTIILFLSLSRNIYPQSYLPAKKYPVSELLKDYNMLINSFKTAHPGVYWHTDSAEFALETQKIRADIAAHDSLTEIGFFRYAARINHAVRCSHSYVWPSDAYDEWWHENASLVPFNLMEAENKYYVYQNYSGDEHLKKGTQVHAINGQAIDDIISRLMPCIPADGNNTSRKKHALKTGFYSYYSLFINESSPVYTVSCSALGSADTSVFSVNGITKKQLDERRDALKKPTPLLNIYFIDSLETAMLKVATFRKDLLEDEGINFTLFMDSAFDVISKRAAKQLVIDLRDNGGGMSEYGAILLEYIAQKPFEYCRNQWVTSDTLYSFLQYDIPGTFSGFPQGVVKTPRGYKWLKHSVLKLRKPAANRFAGKVYFIINGKGASATSEVASIASENKMGLFIGEEVGGSYKGNNGGVLGWVTLPHTGIGAQIAFVKYELAVKDDNGDFGVQPDFPVNYTITDMLAGRDLEIESILNQLLKR